MTTQGCALLTGYTGIWPREALETPEVKKEVKKKLTLPGVYVLYRDDVPYYVGRSSNLWHRLHTHAMRSPNQRHHFWNFFSAFAVPQQHIGDAEALLIAVLPSAVNDANPKIPAIRLERDAQRHLRRLRLRRAGFSQKQIEIAVRSNEVAADDSEGDTAE